MKRIKIYYLTILLLFLAACSSDSDISASSEGTGTAGSFASFIIIDDYLYAINAGAIHTYLLEENGEMTFSSSLSLDSNLETLFPYGDLLLVGSQNGVFFLD